MMRDKREYDLLRQLIEHQNHEDRRTKLQWHHKNGSGQYASPTKPTEKFAPVGDSWMLFHLRTLKKLMEENDEKK